MKPVFVTVAGHHDIYLDAGSVSGVLPDEVAESKAVSDFIVRRMLKVERIRTLATPAVKPRAPKPKAALKRKPAAKPKPKAKAAPKKKPAAKAKAAPKKKPAAKPKAKAAPKRRPAAKPKPKKKAARKAKR